jgi:hypothetical protein
VLREAGQTRVVVDGEESPAGPLPLAGNLTLDRLGHCAPDLWLAGRLAHVAVFSRALPPARAAAHLSAAARAGAVSG